MTSSLIQMLTELTLVTSIAIIVVALMRRLLRWVAGIQVAYWLWLLVPISALAARLPPLPSGIGGSKALAGALRSVVNIEMYSEQVARATVDYSTLATILWVAGCGFTLVFVIRRQLAFHRSLGDAPAAAGDICHSASVRGPLLVGIFRPRIVLPNDFESRYTPEERALILAHERAHLRRGDILISGIATLWLCLFWFNPLMYWAIARLRLDQELACDAAVLAGSRIGRRRYADALLRTHLAHEAAWRTPVACCWQSDHPLKERIAMLSRPLPNFSRRLGGAAVTAALILSGGYATWCFRPDPAYGQPSETNWDGQIAIHADRIIRDNDDAALSGNVVIILTPSAPVAIGLGVVKLVGGGRYNAEARDLRVSAGKHVITAELGTVEIDGTQTILRTDNARVSPYL